MHLHVKQWQDMQLSWSCRGRKGHFTFFIQKSSSVPPDCGEIQVFILRVAEYLNEESLD